MRALQTCVVALCCRLAAAEFPTYDVTAVSNLPGGEAAFGGSPQGIADPSLSTEGMSNTLVLSGKNELRRVTYTNASDKAFSFVSEVVNDDAIPPAWKNQSYDHIGDADWYLDFIIVPVEEPSYTAPALLVYNASSLGFSGNGVKTQQKHCPWVAAWVVDGDTTYLVSSEYDSVEALYVYTWPNIQFVGHLAVENVGGSGLMHVQGGVVRNGVLFLSTDQRQNPGDIFAFNLTAALKNTTSWTTAPKLASWTTSFQGGLAETEGLTVDSNGRMWVVTNLGILRRPQLYTLEPQ
eukprot:Hpha_TRINITY_DN27791_c0_g1::TRINITY_DN27791_c0_g1_i1::g.157125::m.157125